MLRYLPLVAVLCAQPLIAAEKSEPEIKTLVFTGNQCLVTAQPLPDGEKGQFLGALLGFLAPIAVEFLFDQAAESLTKVRTKTSTGSLEMPLWKLEERTEGGKGVEEKVTTDKLVSNLPRCVTVLTGHFSEADKSRHLETIVTSVAVPPKSEESGLRARLASNAINMDKVYLAFETELVTDDGFSFSYKPVYFKSFALIPGHSAKRQGMVYNLSFQGPGTTPWGTVYSTSPINLGTVNDGFELHRDGDEKQTAALAKLVTGKLAAPGISEDAYRTYLQNGETPEMLKGGQVEFRTVGSEFVYRYRVDPGVAQASDACRQEYFRDPASGNAIALAGRFHCYFTKDDTGASVPFNATAPLPALTFSSAYTPISTYERDAFMPARLYVEIVQTQKPTASDKVLAALLGKVKPKATGWAGGLFDEDAKFTKRQADLAVETAYYDALAKRNALIASGTASQEALRAAELTFERAEAAWRRAQND